MSAFVTRGSLRWAVISAAVLASPTASMATEPETTLGKAGKTVLQQQTGDGVTQVCGRFGGGALATNSLETDLFERCREMVQTANFLDGSPPTPNTLSLTEDELAAALQQLTSEEAAAPGQLTSEVANAQQGNVASRIAALRGGIRGFSLQGLAALRDDPASTFGSSFARSGSGGGMAAGGESGIDLGGRLGGFVNAAYGWGDRDGTPREDGFDFDSFTLTGGVDYRFTDNFVAGAAIGYGKTSVDFDRSPTVAAGKVDTDGVSATVYGTLYDEQGYLDASVSVGTADNDTERNILYDVQDRTARASPDSRFVSWSLGGGYDFSHEALTYGVYGSLAGLHLHIDDYTESGAGGLVLAVDKQKARSLMSTLGVQANYAWNQSWGVLLPFVRLQWNHEFQNDSRTVVARYVHEVIPAGGNATQLLARTDSPDRNFFVLGAGTSAVLKDGLQAFFEYELLLGHQQLTSHAITGGLRMEF